MQSLKTYLMSTIFVQVTMVGEVRAQSEQNAVPSLEALTIKTKTKTKKNQLRSSLFFPLRVLLTESYTAPLFLKPMECISNGESIRPMRETFLEDVSSLLRS